MPARGTGPETFDEIDASGGGVGRVAHPTRRCSGPATPSPGTATSGRSTLSTPRDWTTGWPKSGRSGGVRPLQLPPLGRGRHRGPSRRVGPAVGGMTALTDEDVAVPVEHFEGQLDDTGYYLRPVTDTRLWQRRSTARRWPSPSRLARLTTSSRPANGWGVSLACRPVLPTVLFGGTRIITYEEDLFLFVPRKVAWKTRAPN